MRTWIGAAALALCLAPAGAWADAVELKNGVRFFGEILEEDERSLTIQTKEGTLTFPRGQVKSIEKTKRDRPPAAAPKGDKGPPAGGDTAKVSAKPPRRTTYDGLDVQGPLANLVARVGPGGVQRSEFDVYALRAARKAGKSPAELAPEERRAALDEAIEDEIVFQDALAAGLLRHEYIQWRITEEFRNRQTTATIEPRAFTDDDLRRHYDTHSERFTEPGAVDVEIVELPEETSEEEARAAATKARESRDALSGWRGAGWVKKGDPITTAISGLDAVVDLAVGQVSEPLRNPARQWVVCRVTDRREPRRMTFEEAHGKVRFDLIGETQGRLDAGLRDGLRADDGLDDDERLFRAALRAGGQRDWQVRQRIINEHLAKLGVNPGLKVTKKREEVLPEMRARFPVEVLME